MLLNEQITYSKYVNNTNLKILFINIFQLAEKLTLCLTLDLWLLVLFFTI